MTDELIRRSDAIEAVKAYLDLCCLTEAKFHRGMEDYNEEISTEILEKIEPKRGKWIHHEPFDKEVRNCEPCRECSCCHTWYQYDGIPRLNFCPNCGAKMGEREGE